MLGTGQPMVGWGGQGSGGVIQGGTGRAARVGWCRKSSRTTTRAMMRLASRDAMELRAEGGLVSDPRHKVIRGFNRFFPCTP